MEKFDVAVVGGGVMGCSTVLHLSRNQMRTIIIDSGALCSEASGTNAGTLTLNMTRAALIPYAIKGWELWNNTEKWLFGGVGTRKVNGLSLAFTEEEEELLFKRVEARQAMGAPIKFISGRKAQLLEPGLNDSVRSAAWCNKDGFTIAYLTGHAFRRALKQENVSVREYSKVNKIEIEKNYFKIIFENNEHLKAKRIVLAGGVWLEEMLNWLNVKIKIKCLINQLIITERMPPVMKTVLSIANGLLSLKQFDNGTVLIGGGWQGIGDKKRGGVESIPENLIGNIRLACHVIPKLRYGRMVRVWLGLEAETADALPIIGKIPGISNAYVIGSVHSGYASGPYMGWLLSQLIMEQEPEMPLFDPNRLINI